MKKHCLLSTAGFIILSTTAFAANPFTDVDSSNWAYQSVAQLAQAGIINGYPDATFKGQNSITRYEMSQMVAKAMAHQDKANAEQQAIINRLADEFSSELNNLGIRVTNLEQKVGNVKTTGDLRLRYRGSEKKGVMKANSKSKFDYRARIQFEATVNDKTTATVRVRTDDAEFGDAKSNNLEFDRAFINHKFTPHLSVAAGRTGLRLGEGLTYNYEPFDGVLGLYKNGSFQFEAGYGAMTSFYAFSFPTSRHSIRKISKITTMDADENPTFTILQARENINQKINLSAYYLFGNKNIDTDVYGFATDIKPSEKTWLGGEWIKANDFSNGTAWVAGLGYGNYKITKSGSWDIKAQYFDEDYNAPIFTSRFPQPWAQNYKGYLATVDYALYKNVGFVAYYGFNSKTQEGKDLGDYYRAEINLNF